MLKPKVIAGTLAVIAAAVLIYFVLTINNVKPGTRQAQEIEGVINQFFFLIDQVNQDGNCSIYAEVLGDTRDYRPDAQTKQFVIQTLNKGSNFEPGYLSAMTADCVAHRGDPVRIQAEQTQTPNSNSGSTTQTKITFTSITVRGNRATVLYETPWSSDTATLVRIKGRWYISNIKAIAHF